MKNQLKKELLNQLLLKLLDLGFERKIYGQTFWKPIDIGHAAVHLSFIDHVDDFDITLDFTIRVEELEAIKNKDNINLSEKEKKGTATI